MEKDDYFSLNFLDLLLSLSLSLSSQCSFLFGTKVMPQMMTLKLVRISIFPPPPSSFKVKSEIHLFSNQVGV